MQHSTQLRILDELFEMLDAGRTVDAGQQLLNPTSAYTDPALAAQEWQRFFREHPQLIGLSGDLPGPGSYLTLDDFGVPILACRDEDGRFRAFVNACRHRGTRLTEDERGEQKRFTCPFHGWTYATDGRLLGVTESEQFGAIDRNCHNLIELPTAEQYGLLWVHPQPAASIDVDALLGGLAPEIANWHLGDRVHCGGRSLNKRMNWKLANDTFGETYHFARLHRKTLNNIFNGEALSYETFERNHRAVFPARSMTRLRNKPRDKWSVNGSTTVLYYLFPNIQLTVSDRQVTLFRIYPGGADASRSVTWMSHYFSQAALDLMADGSKTVIDDSNIYSREARDGNAIVTPEGSMEIIDSTLENEDYRMGETTQQTAESGLLEHIVFGRNEAPLQHFHNTFRAALDMPPLRSS
mgnify:CR=1 FL=1